MVQAILFTDYYLTLLIFDDRFAKQYLLILQQVKLM